MFSDQQDRDRKQKIVSATEAKNRLGALISDVTENARDVIIENHGRPRAVLMSFEEYRALQEVREQQRLREAFGALRQLRQEVLARNQDLDEDAADQLVDEIAADVRVRAAAHRRARAVERAG